MKQLHTLHAPAYAKLNLNLHITGQRGDGYHLLDSLVMFTDVADAIGVMPADLLSLHVDGAFGREAGTADDNLVLRAARALQAETGCTQGAAITLTKNIPVGGGLGGGSADAATALHVLNQLWGLHLSEAELARIGLKLGADVPLCLAGRSTRMQGIGEVLTPITLPALHAVLVHPRVPLLTKTVFGAYRAMPHQGEMSAPTVTDLAGMLDYLRTTRNDLQAAAMMLEPLVSEVLTAIEGTGAAFVRMTGSGACCFGLFETPSQATQAANILAQAHTGWWVSATTLG